MVYGLRLWFGAVRWYAAGIFSGISFDRSLEVGVNLSRSVQFWDEAVSARRSMCR